MVRTVVIKKKEIQTVQDLMLFVELQKYIVLRNICEKEGYSLEEQSTLFFPSNVLKQIVDLEDNKSGF
jgi:hypothetical protein